MSLEMTEFNGTTIDKQQRGLPRPQFDLWRGLRLSGNHRRYKGSNPLKEYQVPSCNLCLCKHHNDMKLIQATTTHSLNQATVSVSFSPLSFIRGILLDQLQAE
eukprot:1834282-Amphidinium_carterae.1